MKASITVYLEAESVEGFVSRVEGKFDLSRRRIPAFFIGPRNARFPNFTGFSASVEQTRLNKSDNSVQKTKSGYLPPGPVGETIGDKFD